ncbi:unnamed protein product [Protopolystoma xenopodis]|uniref:Uncharacterized protein n=1 Tax=Protopolystoma xenopodis TaxID=117903 RepID=A0A448WU18_9PLAT|nr:unnamed protein product [Protopolystoma xenopodis]
MDSYVVLDPVTPPTATHSSSFSPTLLAGHSSENCVAGESEVFGKPVDDTAFIGSSQKTEGVQDLNAEATKSLSIAKEYIMAAIDRVSRRATLAIWSAKCEWRTLRHCLAYTLITWERTLRQQDASRHFFNGDLSERHATGLGYMLRASLAAHARYGTVDSDLFRLPRKQAVKESHLGPPQSSSLTVHKSNTLIGASIHSPISSHLNNFASGTDSETINTAPSYEIENADEACMPSTSSHCESTQHTVTEPPWWWHAFFEPSTSGEYFSQIVEMTT